MRKTFGAGSGRSQKIRACPGCGREFNATDMRTHKPRRPEKAHPELRRISILRNLQPVESKMSTLTTPNKPGLRGKKAKAKFFLDHAIHETLCLWRRHHLDYDQTKYVVEQVRRSPPDDENFGHPHSERLCTLSNGSLGQLKSFQCSRIGH